MWEATSSRVWLIVTRRSVGAGGIEVPKMVYAIQESLVCVFAGMIAAALAFIFCAATLLAEEALRHAYRAGQEIGGVISRRLVARFAPSRERKGKVLPAGLHPPGCAPNIPTLGAEPAIS